MAANCILGGTFTYVHQGHLRLLSKCRKFTRVVIGLTSNEYVRRHKIYPSLPYSKRLAGLKAALKRIGLARKTRIVKIEDEAGGADSEQDLDAIVVSEETASAAKRINLRRRKRGLRALEIIAVPLLYGQDLRKISCTRIFEGQIDAEGKLRRPLMVQVATDNPTKLKGASSALARVFGKKFAITHHCEDSRVCRHPFNEETFAGAKNRAHAAWKRANGNARGRRGGAAKRKGCDYALGIESGLFSGMCRGMHIDITICCVYDGKEESYGTGMGFVVPQRIVRRIVAKKSDLSEALRGMTGIKKIGWRQGALGWFSDGMMHRAEQIEASVACAFVPRIARAKKGMEY